MRPHGQRRVTRDERHHLAHRRHAAALVAAEVARDRPHGEPLIRDALLIGAGGFIGSIARFYLAGVANAVTGPAVAGGARFPTGTLVVNALGCLLIGVLASVAQHGQPWSLGARLFLFTGLLGGFTTFSAFGYETVELARTGAYGMAGLNVAAQLTVGLLAVWVGFRLVAVWYPTVVR